MVREEAAGREGRPRAAGAPPAPLVPRRRVPAVGVVVLVAVLGVVALGGHVAGGSSPGGLEVALARLVPMATGTAAVVGEAFADLGGPVVAPVLLLALVVPAVVRRGGRGLALLLVVPPVAVATTSLLLKPLVGRTHEGYLSWPSGHTTSLGALAAVTAVLVASDPRVGRGLRVAVVAALVGLVVVVGVCLVGRGHHDAADVLGAFGVVVALTGAGALLVDAVANARRSRSADAPGVGAGRRPTARRGAADPGAV